MRILTIACTIAVFGGGCRPIKVEPIKVEPIHITLDINIKIDRQLDDFFDFEDEIEQSTE